MATALRCAAPARPSLGTARRASPAARRVALSSGGAVALWAPGWRGAAKRPSVTRVNAAAGEQGAEAQDHYDALEASPADTVDTLRENYRRLQKRLHPDVAGSSPASVERSVAVNVAWTVLSEPASRASYDATRAGLARRARGGRGRGTRTPIRREGLVGPLRSERLLATLIPRRATFSELLSGSELRDSVREFAKTLAFAADLPLPLPLQVDDTPLGVRLAMMRVAPGGGLASVGELLVEVVELDDQCDVDAPERTCDWRATVLRRWPENDVDEDTQLPGEDRILKALEREFRHLVTVGGSSEAKPSGWAMPGWLAAMGAWALPALPLGQDSGVGGELSGYYLQRSCRLARDGRRPASSAR